MSHQWVVVLRTGETDDDHQYYGPIDGEEHARRFAAFMAAEVDPAVALKLRQPVGELLAWYANQASSSWAAADHWPPKAGDIWQDRDGNRWTSQVYKNHVSKAVDEVHDRYLVCLAFTADDSAEEINKKYGPMTLVYRPDVKELECPF